MYISPFILDEVTRVLRRTFHREEAVVEEAIAFLSLYCEMIDPPAEMSLRELSPQDNRVLDCAIRGNVQYLVTGDKGILRLGAFQGIRIVRPAESLTLIESG